MKKKLLFICVAAIIILAAVNVNFAFNSGSDVNLSLASIMALARGETYYCSVCGNQIDVCTCPANITCSYTSCHGKECHIFTGIWSCPCDPTGYPLNICPL